MACVQFGPAYEPNFCLLRFRFYPHGATAAQDSGTTVVGAVCARTKDNSYTASRPPKVSKRDGGIDEMILETKHCV